MGRIRTSLLRDWSLEGGADYTGKVGPTVAVFVYCTVCLDVGVKQNWGT